MCLGENGANAAVVEALRGVAPVWMHCRLLLQPLADFSSSVDVEDASHLYGLMVQLHLGSKALHPWRAMVDVFVVESSFPSRAITNNWFVFTMHLRARSSLVIRSPSALL